MAIAPPYSIELTKYPWAKAAIDSLYTQVTQFLAVEHNDNGTHAIGIYTDVPYAATNFSAATGTWTVDPADVVTYEWAIVGEMMTVEFEINTTDVSAATLDLQIKIPNGRTAARRTRALVQVVDAGVAQVGVARVVENESVIRIQATIGGTPWTITAADDAAVRGQITFRVKAIT